MDGLISNFDTENFDMTSLLESLNMTGLDISSIAGMFNDPDFDFGSIFENFDYQSLGAIKLDLTGLLESADIDLSEFGINLSDYDTSAISIAELIDALSKSEFIMTADGAISKLFKIDYDNLNFDGLITSFDAENFDISGILEGFNLSGFDISGIFGNFDMNGIDITEFLNTSISLLIEKTLLESAQC